MHTILCVDDDPFYLDLYRNILELKGFRVVTACDAGLGLKAVEKEKPDLILLDVMMPEKSGFRDGYALLEELRRAPASAKTPIIMISALGDEADAKHGIDVGASEYLPKQHLTTDGLLKLINKYLV